MTDDFSNFGLEDFLSFFRDFRRLTEDLGIDCDAVVFHLDERFDEGRFEIERELFERGRFEESVAQNRRGVEGREDFVGGVLRDGFGRDGFERHAFSSCAERVVKIVQTRVEVGRREIVERAPRFPCEREIVGKHRVKSDSAQFNPAC